LNTNSHAYPRFQFERPFAECRHDNNKIQYGEKATWPSLDLLDLQHCRKTTVLPIKNLPPDI